MFITTKTHKEQLAALDEKLRKDTEEAIAALREEYVTKLETFQSFEKEAREQHLTTVTEMLSKHLEDAAAQSDKLFDEALKRDRVRRYESDEPYVEIISESISDDGGVNLRLDWNQAFVKHLRAGGMQGATDELLIDNWISSLNSERQAGAAGR